MELHRGRLLDHVHLGVKDLEASKRFYKAALGALDVPIGGEAADHFWSDELFVSTAESKAAQGSRTGRVHLAFQAPNRAAVDAFHKAVRDLQDAGFDTCETAVPFGDPTQASMATIEADRARIGTEAFSDVDVILLPTLDSTVPTVAAASANPEQGVSAETTAFANYYSLPAASVPCGFDSHGMPIGLQIVGRPGDERTVLSVAHRYEAAATFGSRHPVT
jgi:catechol 2,3-dioxygenase-like lactoylglutathione lyase family enzyme